MLIKEKRKLIDILESELFDMKVLRLNDEDSPYLVDYLYGISDVEKEIIDFLHTTRNEEWILLNQILLNKEIINSKEYFLYNMKLNSYFIMKDKNDLKKFKSFITEEKEAILSKYKEEINTIKNEYHDKFKNSDLCHTFKNLLENYFEFKDEGKESPNYLKATYELGEFLKKYNRKGEIEFKQSDFFKERLGFKTNNEYPDLKKEYEKIRSNA